jgi:type III restriction enzyme
MPITRQLLHHWNNPERDRTLFFCQREAAETLIFVPQHIFDSPLRTP